MAFPYAYLRTLAVCSVLMLLSCSVEAEEQRSEVAILIRQLADFSKTVSEDITEKLKTPPPPPSPNDRHTYQDFVARYQAYFKPLRALYPEGVLAFRTDSVLKPYADERTTYHIQSWYLPYMLFSAGVYSNTNIRFEKLVSRVGEKNIYGLRMRTELPPRLRKQSPEQLVSLLYIEDINARILGFSHAQLIPQASRNVVPAAQFHYNDFLDWSQHKRYGMEDQFNKPLELTNYCHASRGDYVTSDHPDFALHFTNYDSQTVVLTFFLWRSHFLSTLIGRVIPQEKRLPDFIFQIEFLHK